MTANDESIDESRAATIGQNIECVRSFFRHALDDRSRIDGLPDDATIVVVPRDDPKAAAANVSLADRRGEDETPIYLWVTDMAGEQGARPSPADRILSFRPFVVPWAEADAPNRHRFVYDAGRDVLLIDLLGGARQGLAMRPDGAAYVVLVDLETLEGFGYLVPRFLGRAILEVPKLAVAMAAAEFRPLRPEELGGLDDAVFRRPPATADLAELRREIALLSA